MDLAWKVAATVVAVTAGLYVRVWLLKSQGQAVHFPFLTRKR